MSTRTWHLRPRPERLGKHRALPTITETDMPPASPAASLPQHDYRTTAELQQAALKPAFDPPADPYRQVQCTFCGAIGLAADMPDHGRGPRCYPDTEGCGHRWAAGKPVSLLPPRAEALRQLPTVGEIRPLIGLPPEPAPVLPPAQEAALAAFEAAHDEAAAAEGKDLSEAPAPATPVGAEAPDSNTEPEPVGPESAAEPPADTAEPAPVAAEPEPQDGGEGE